MEGLGGGLTYNEHQLCALHYTMWFTYSLI